MRCRPLVAPLLLLALALAGCQRADPVVPAPVVAEPRKQAPAAPPPPMRDRPEYSEMPGAGSMTYSTTTDQAIAAEAQRGGPRGEPRLFETPEEQNELARGASPKYMNGQFRYYLAGIALMPPQGECQKPLLALRLAVENLHGLATAAIHGTFTFTKVVGGDGSSLTESMGVPYRADIPGPFSNKQGGAVYVVAYLEPNDTFDAERWSQITSVNPERLKIWFKPEAFYYADGTQYTPRTGKVPAQREPMTCGGTEGAQSLLR